MKSTPSPRVRFLAVLALILFAGGVAYLLIHSSSGSNSANSTTGTTATSTTTTQTHSTTTSTQTKPEKKRKKPVEGVAALDAALVNHPIVVVSVYARNVALDVSAMEEARAGAARAGAGFIAFNIYDEKLARQLAELVGADSQVASPSVLFFKRPRALAFALQGFSDSQVVAQAAQNVFPHTEPWVGEANLVCSRYSTSLAKAQLEATSADTNTAAGRKQAAAALEKAAALLNQEAKALGKVRANSSKAAKFAQLVSDLKQVSVNMSSEASALRNNDSATAKTIDQKNTTLIAAVTTLASELQLTTCAS